MQSSARVHGLTSGARAGCQHLGASLSQEALCRAPAAQAVQPYAVAVLLGCSETSHLSPLTFLSWAFLVSLWMPLAHVTFGGYLVKYPGCWHPFQPRVPPETAESLGSWNRAVFPLLPAPELCHDPQWNIEKTCLPHRAAERLPRKQLFQLASLSTSFHRVQHQ